MQILTTHKNSTNFLAGLFIYTLATECISRFVCRECIPNAAGVVFSWTSLPHSTNHSKFVGFYLSVAKQIEIGGPPKAIWWLHGCLHPLPLCQTTLFRINSFWFLVSIYVHIDLVMNSSKHSHERFALLNICRKSLSVDAQYIYIYAFVHGWLRNEWVYV